jgi:hypothetical protein
MGDRPQEFVRRGEEGVIPNAVLVELLQAVLERGAPFWFEAPGFSMSPFIQDGDTITVAPLAGAPPRPGDVVAFLRPDSGKLVVHRVVGKRGDAFLIRGDNGGEVDDLAPAAGILGRVTGVRRDGRPVRLGLGPERRLVAFLSRRGLLQPLLRRVWPLLRPIARRLSS